LVWRGPSGALALRVDAPHTLTIDEAAFLTARVQAREVGRERVERVCYVEHILASDGDKHAIGFELERGWHRTPPNPEDGGEGIVNAGRGRCGSDEPGQRQGRPVRGQQGMRQDSEYKQVMAHARLRLVTLARC